MVECFKMPNSVQYAEQYGGYLPVSHAVLIYLAWASVVQMGESFPSALDQTPR